MKPFTENDAKQWAEQENEGIMLNYEKCKEIPQWMRDSGQFLECWKAGCWLNAILEDNGATKKQVYDIIFCHGQRSSMAPKEHAWKWAVHYVNEFIYNSKVKDKPGIELADRIIAETIVIV